MRIEHIALWARNAEALSDFYQHWFGAERGARYENPAKGFLSFFLRFTDGARLEIMQRDEIHERPAGEAMQQHLGYAHLALTAGSEAAVDQLTARLVAAGIRCIDGPRRTGDGYYESVILDPEGNRIEITA